METGMMKVVFSSIINGTIGDLSANETPYSDLNSVSDKNGCGQPDIRYSQPQIKTDGFNVKSQEVFASLVNAANCANLHSDYTIDGYLTWTADGAFIRDYHH